MDRELFLLLGGTASLLMQVAHPLVAAGVDRHSDFARDPIGRLHRTLDTTLAVVFADPAQAHAALRRIDRRHGAVRFAVVIAIVRLMRAVLPDALKVVPQARRWESRARTRPA